MLAARDGNRDLVGPQQAVGNDDGGADGVVRESMFVGQGHVVDGVVASPRVEGVGVRHERPAADARHPIDHRAGDRRLDVALVPRLAEVLLDRAGAVARYGAGQPRDVRQLHRLVGHAGVVLTVADREEVDFGLGHAWNSVGVQVSGVSAARAVDRPVISE